MKTPYVILGNGMSYLTKYLALRSLLTNQEIIFIDPKDEYKNISHEITCKPGLQQGGKLDA